MMLSDGADYTDRIYSRRDLRQVISPWRLRGSAIGRDTLDAGRLLRPARVVRGDAPQPLHEATEAASRSLPRRAGRGGRISRCAGGWCHFDVRGRNGFIRVDVLWGVEPNETIR